MLLFGYIYRAYQRRLEGQKDMGMELLYVQYETKGSIASEEKLGKNKVKSAQLLAHSSCQEL